MLVMFSLIEVTEAHNAFLINQFPRKNPISDAPSLAGIGSYLRRNSLIKKTILSTCLSTIDFDSFFY